MGDVSQGINGHCLLRLTFHAGITSSIAMCTPIVSFLQDNFDVKKRKRQSLGVSVLLCGLHPLFSSSKEFLTNTTTGRALPHSFSLHDGNNSFLMGRTYQKNWKEFTWARHPCANHFKYILLYITPVLLIIIFLTAFFKP